MMLTPLSVSFQPSRTLAAILIAAHAASGIVLALLPLLLWLKAAGVAIVAAAAWHYVRHYALLRTASASREIRLLADGKIDILRRDWHTARLMGEQFVHPSLTIVRCRLENRRWPISIVILPDMLDAESFRELRVRLKWQR